MLVFLLSVTIPLDSSTLLSLQNSRNRVQSKTIILPSSLIYNVVTDICFYSINEPIYIVEKLAGDVERDIFSIDSGIARGKRFAILSTTPSKRPRTSIESYGPASQGAIVKQPGSPVDTLASIIVQEPVADKQTTNFLLQATTILESKRSVNTVEDTLDTSLYVYLRYGRDIKLVLEILEQKLEERRTSALYLDKKYRKVASYLLAEYGPALVLIQTRLGAPPPLTLTAFICYYYSYGYSFDPDIGSPIEELSRTRAIDLPTRLSPTSRTPPMLGPRKSLYVPTNPNILTTPIATYLGASTTLISPTSPILEYDRGTQPIARLQLSTYSTKSDYTSGLNYQQAI